MTSTPPTGFTYQPDLPGPEVGPIGLLVWLFLTVLLLAFVVGGIIRQRGWGK